MGQAQPTRELWEMRNSAIPSLYRSSVAGRRLPFAARPKVTPDPAVKSRFEAALARAEAEAQRALKNDAKNHDALFTMTLVYGLRADYAGLIEKRNVGALSYTRQASDWGEKLTKAAPDYYDGYCASGISKYIIGSMAAPVRWLLRIGGYVTALRRR